MKGRVSASIPAAASAGASAARGGRVPLWVRAAVGALLILLILSQLNLGDLRRIIIAPRWLPLLGMVAAAQVSIVLGSVNVWILLSVIGRARLFTVWRYCVVAAALGNVTPASLGNFSLIGFLRRDGLPVHRGLAVMLVDRGITLALCAFIFVPLTLGLVLSERQWLWLGATCAAGLVGLLLLNGIASVRRWLLVRVVRPLLPQAEGFLRTTSGLLRLHPLALLANVALTLLRSVVSGVVVSLALLAAGARAELAPAVVITNSLSLLNYIPISISGLGAYEGGAVALFTRLGLDGERVFAAFVFLRLYTVAYSLIALSLFRILVRRDQVGASPERV